MTKIKIPSFNKDMEKLKPSIPSETSRWFPVKEVITPTIQHTDLNPKCEPTRESKTYVHI